MATCQTLKLSYKQLTGVTFPTAADTLISRDEVLCNNCKCCQLPATSVDVIKKAPLDLNQPELIFPNALEAEIPSSEE